MFGPTLPPPDKTVLRRSSNSTDLEDRRAKKRRRQSGRDAENSSSVKKSERHGDNVPGGSSRREVGRSRRISAHSSRSSSDRSSASGSPSSKSGKESPRTKSRSSVSASGSGRKISGTRRSRTSSSRSHSGRRKQVRRSSSSSSTSSGGRSKTRGKESAGVRSRKDRFAERDNHRRSKALRQDSGDRKAVKDRGPVLPRKSHLAADHWRSRDDYTEPFGKHAPVSPSKRSGRRSDGFDRRDSGDHKPATKSGDRSIKPLADYSSSDSEDMTETRQANRGGKLSSSATDSTRQAASSDTAAAVDHKKDADAAKTQAAAKPKETLEDMEQFLKQLKANKQQMLKKS